MGNEKKKDGFTLVEIMISMLILSVVVIGTAALLSQTGSSIWKDAHARTATEVANDILEEALRVNYDLLANATATETRNGIAYTVNRNVTEYALPIPYKEAEVSVTYNGQTIASRTFAIKGFGIATR